MQKIEFKNLYNEYLTIKAQAPKLVDLEEVDLSMDGYESEEELDGSVSEEDQSQI